MNFIDLFIRLAGYIDPKNFREIIRVMKEEPSGSKEHRDASDQFQKKVGPTIGYLAGKAGYLGNKKTEFGDHYGDLLIVALEESYKLYDRFYKNKSWGNTTDEQIFGLFYKSFKMKTKGSTQSEKIERDQVSLPKTGDNNAFRHIIQGWATMEKKLHKKVPTVRDAIEYINEHWSIDENHSSNDRLDWIGSGDFQIRPKRRKKMIPVSKWVAFFNAMGGKSKSLNDLIQTSDKNQTDQTELVHIMPASIEYSPEKVLLKKELNKIMKKYMDKIFRGKESKILKLWYGIENINWVKEIKKRFPNYKMKGQDSKHDNAQKKKVIQDILGYDSVKTIDRAIKGSRDKFLKWFEKNPKEAENAKSLMAKNLRIVKLSKSYEEIDNKIKKSFNNIKFTRQANGTNKFSIKGKKFTFSSAEKLVKEILKKF